MVDLSAINDILSIRNGVWSLVALFVVGMWRGWAGLPAVMQQWIARRQAIAAEKDAEWKRLRDEVVRIDGRCDFLQREVDECREREGKWMSRALTAEAIVQGHGEVRQAAAAASAEARLAEIDRNKKGDGK